MQRVPVSHHTKRKIVFLDAYTNNPGDISFYRLVQLGDVDIYDRTNLDELKSRASEAEILIVNKFVINDQSLEMIPNVKYIVVAATGFNNIDMRAVTKRNIKVSNVSGYSADSVAQHVLATLLHHFNKIDYYRDAVNSGRWADCPDFCFYDHTIVQLSNLTLGIVGYGAIGSRVGQLASAFGMKVIALVRDRSKSKPDFVNYVTEDELFAQSDIVTLHCPLNESTKEVIRMEHLLMMKNTAFVVNTGRGGLVNEA
ncbi:MAG: NAD(P)-dependent oxidoreductase, partial [Saprospiraceae bacterium]